MSRRPDDYEFQVHELVARYELHPEFRDLFVEGESDADLLSWFGRQAGLARLSVYQVNSVYLPEEVVPQRYRSGNRGRVIALALSLEKELSKKLDNVYGLIDRDVDVILDEIPICARLWLTDFCSMDSYYVQASVLDRVFSLYFRVTLSSTEFEQLQAVLAHLFLIRTAKEKFERDTDVDQRPSWVKVGPSLAVEDGIITLVGEDFLGRLLTRRGYVEFHSFVMECLEQFGTRQDLDHRDKVHKSDFYEVVGWLARFKGVANKLCDVEVLSGVFLSHFAAEDLAAYPLFNRIKQWAA